MTLSDKDRALAGPRALKEPGSPEWCWQTVQYLREAMRHVAEEYRQAEQVLEELKQAKAWTKIPPGRPYGSLDSMLRAEIGMPAKAVMVRIREAAERAKALEGKTVRQRGRPPKAEAENGDVITINETAKGTSADYLTRRIARDHPEIFERLKAGEYQSARAAALDAGIVKRTVAIRVDPQAAARIIRKHFTPAQLKELARLLLEGE